MLILAGLDLDHLTLYCSDCKDYVYDLELEYRIHQERARIERLVINAAGNVLSSFAILLMLRDGD